VLQRYIQMYPEYEEDLWLLVSEVAASEGDIPPPATPPSTLLHMLREDAQAAFAGVQEAEITSLLARAREHAGLDAAALSG
jgi:hypothetical protein